MNRLILFFVLTLSCIGINTIADVSVIRSPAILHLPDSDVLCIYEDQEGYVWYGTSHGLFRDDGYDAVGFFTEDDNRINCIAEDLAGNIWFGTPKGLYKIVRDDYSIVEIDEKRMQNESVRKLYLTKDGNVWASILGFLRKYDADGNCIKEYAVPDAENNRKVYIDAFCQTRNGDIYIACGKPSLYKYNDKTDEFKPTSFSPELNNLTGAFQDINKDFLWVTTKYGGILRFFPSDSRFETALTVPKYNKEPVYPINDEIYSIAQDSTTLKLWVAGRNGIRVYENSDSGLLISYDKIENHDGGLYHNIVSGYAGKIWLPSSYGVPALGINGSLNPFVHNPLIAVEDRLGRNVAIRNLCMDKDRRYIWLIQPRLGLVLYDLEANKMSVQSDFSELSNIRLHEAKILAHSSFGDGVWVGRNGRRTVHLMKKGDRLSMKRVMTVDFSGVVDPMVNVTCLYESTDGKLWIGTDDGFLCYNLSDGKFIREKDGCGMVMAIRESTAGDIWIATKAEGLYCLSMDSIYSRRYPSLKGISDMAFVGNSIWLASENGKLMSLDAQSNMVSDISERFGIGNERIISLHNDEDNHVWVVTPNKVVKTLPEKGVAHAFDATEFGLERIAVIDKNLRSPILGGIGGICAVNNDIEIVNFDVHLPKVTKIECDGFPILSVPENQLKIKSDNKNLKFYISSFNHVSPHKSEFRYKLKGFDDNWRKISGGENILSYDNLPSGRYTLELASLMEDGSWGDSSEVLSVYKEYSIWLKWWMISIYVIILLGFIYVGIMIIKRHYKNRSEELIRDRDEMLKLTHYLESPVSLPQPEFNDFDKILLENVTKIIETNMESPDFDINMLASNMNMSRSTLTRKIKAITGKNPGDLIQDIKMQHACQYLKNGELTITEISDKIGYDRRYFTSVFRRKFGMTPREYMQNNKDA